MGNSGTLLQRELGAEIDAHDAVTPGRYRGDAGEIWGDTRRRDPNPNPTPNPDPTPTPKQEVRQAARRAQIHDAIERMPQVNLTLTLTLTPTLTLTTPSSACRRAMTRAWANAA